MRRLIVLLLGGVLLTAPPARAATCVEGLIMLEKTLRKMELNDEEFNIVTDLMFKAKVESDRGNMQKCVFIVGDIIRVIFLRNGQKESRF
jgi:hypothetical protein